MSLYTMSLYPGGLPSETKRMVHSQAFTIRNPPAYAVIKAIKKAGIKMNEPITERTPLSHRG